MSPIAAVLQPFLDRGAIVGVVTVVADRRRVLALDALGWADRAARAPMQADSLFWIASISKALTSVAVLMLADEGRIALDDPVERYLPEFAGQMVAVERAPERAALVRPPAPFTVRQVLAHTAGLIYGSDAELRGGLHQLDLYPIADACRIYALSPLQSMPGSAYAYSNAGITIAGRLVEVLAGRPFAEVMDERLLRPLGMVDTTFWPAAAQLARLARTYGPHPDHAGSLELPIDLLRAPFADRGRAPSPAGGYFATAGDIARLGQMVLDDGMAGGRRFLSRAALRQLSATVTGDLHPHLGPGSGYGAGWLTTRPDPGPGLARALVGACGHGGRHGTHLWVDPDAGLVLVFMVQQWGTVGVEVETVRAAFAQAALATYAGRG